MARFGLLGQHLGHSYSPQIHQLLGGYDYDLCQVSPQDLGAFVQAGGYEGLNVTIPYKKAIIPYCGELSPLAERLGSVNTVLRLPDGTLLGGNTDGALPFYAALEASAKALKTYGEADE